jgi:hypothetical protein
MHEREATVREGAGEGHMFVARVGRASSPGARHSSALRNASAWVAVSIVQIEDHAPSNFTYSC